MKNNFEKEVLNYMTSAPDGIPHSSKLLLTLSGGLDSVALLSVLLSGNLTFEVAHCNFQLRAEESDEDEAFVRALCERHCIKLHVKRFNTKELAKRRGLSIQEVARELRYEWFHELLESSNLDWILTAHHKNDAIETFFINLIRGTGLTGLSGIKKVNDKIFRPLLCVNRESIAEYARFKELSYREDSSNSDEKYLRNAIRKNLIPMLGELREGAVETIHQEMDYFKKLDGLLQDYTKEEIQSCIKKDSEERLIVLKKDQLLELKHLEIVLFEYLQTFNFNGSTVQNIVLGLQKSESASYFSNTHEVRRERDCLKIFERSDQHDEAIGLIEDGDTFMDHPVVLEIFKLAELKDDFDPNPKIAYLNLDRLKFPLVVRKWHFGDYFHPLGMQSRKKLSDFFTDQKLESTVKEQTYVVTSEEKIVWIVGMRIDDRYKIVDGTDKILKLKLR